MKIEVESPIPIQHPIKLIPHIFNTDPYIIKNVGQQKMLFNSLWSLKWIEIWVRGNVSATPAACAPYLRIFSVGWTAWIHKRTFSSGNREKRDVAGFLGTGLGVLNSMDSELLMSKMAIIHSNNYGPEPIRTSHTLLSFGIGK